jgi:hypothetical protein
MVTHALKGNHGLAEGSLEIFPPPTRQGVAFTETPLDRLPWRAWRVWLGVLGQIRYVLGLETDSAAAGLKGNIRIPGHLLSCGHADSETTRHGF